MPPSERANAIRIQNLVHAENRSPSRSSGTVTSSSGEHPRQTTPAKTPPKSPNPSLNPTRSPPKTLIDSPVAHPVSTGAGPSNKRPKASPGSRSSSSEGLPPKLQRRTQGSGAGPSSRGGSGAGPSSRGRGTSRAGRFSCDFCSKVYHSRNPRDAHVATVHRQEKKFACPVCGKTYGLSWNRDTHVSRVHSGEKPYVCTLTCKKSGRQCESRFAVRADFERHCRLVHSQIVALYPCAKCGERFQRLVQLRQHEQDCTGIVQ